MTKRPGGRDLANSGMSRPPDAGILLVITVSCVMGAPMAQHTVTELTPSGRMDSFQKKLKKLWDNSGAILRKLFEVNFFVWFSNLLAAGKNFCGIVLDAFTQPYIVRK